MTTAEDKKRAEEKEEHQVKEPNLEDIIDILTEYEVRHQPLPQTLQAVYGLVAFTKKTIYISTEQDMAEARDTVIHELLHVYYRRHNVDAKEPLVRKKAKELYKRLYGDK